MFATPTGSLLRRSIVLIGLGIIISLALVGAYLADVSTRPVTNSESELAAGPVLVPTFTPTVALSPSATATPSPTPAPPTATSTRVVAAEVYVGATANALERATAAVQAKATVVARLQLPTGVQPAVRSRSAAPISYSREARLVLAHYFAWYDDQGWDDCNISAGDKPLEPYHSDDPATIARHVRMAVAVGLSGFTLHWFAPGDRTDRNFATLLNQSEGYNFASSVVFSRHFWPGSPAASRQNIAAALRYLIDQYGDHPNFLRVEGKPVLFFIDVYRAPTRAGESPLQFWAALRQEVDPEQEMWWIAEGLDASYLSVFDGLYVFKISHAAQPYDYVKAPRWGAQVRRWAEQTGRPKLWLATISPGWDDRRAPCKTDVRVPNTPHRLDRADGATYEATFEAALNSNPDWLFLSSFNEWVEGSYIEPSEQYGDKYMQLTRELVRRFREGK